MNAALELGTAMDMNRLSLRALSQEDEALYCGLYTDAQTMQHIGPPLSPQRAQRSFRNALRTATPLASTGRILAVVIRNSDECIGVSGIQGLDERHGRIEAGIVLAASARGRGYSEEALSGTVRLAFRTFPVKEVWVRIAASNEVAQRMVRAIGFEPSEDSDDDRGLDCAAGIRAWSVFRASWTGHGKAPLDGPGMIRG